MRKGRNVLEEAPDPLVEEGGGLGRTPSIESESVVTDTKLRRRKSTSLSAKKANANPKGKSSKSLKSNEKFSDEDIENKNIDEDKDKDKDKDKDDNEDDDETPLFINIFQLLRLLIVWVAKTIIINGSINLMSPKYGLVLPSINSNIINILLGIISIFTFDLFLSPSGLSKNENSGNKLKVKAFILGKISSAFTLFIPLYIHGFLRDDINFAFLDLKQYFLLPFIDKFKVVALLEDPFTGTHLLWGLSYFTVALVSFGFVETFTDKICWILLSFMADNGFGSNVYHYIRGKLEITNDSMFIVAAILLFIGSTIPTSLESYNKLFINNEETDKEKNKSFLKLLGTIFKPTGYILLSILISSDYLITGEIPKSSYEISSRLKINKLIIPNLKLQNSYDLNDNPNSKLSLLAEIETSISTVRIVEKFSGARMLLSNANIVANVREMDQINYFYYRSIISSDSHKVFLENLQERYIKVIIEPYLESIGEINEPIRLRKVLIGSYNDGSGISSGYNVANNINGNSHVVFNVAETNLKSIDLLIGHLQAPVPEESRKLYPPGLADRNIGFEGKIVNVNTADFIRQEVKSRLNSLKKYDHGKVNHKLSKNDPSMKPYDIAILSEWSTLGPSQHFSTSSFTIETLSHLISILDNKHGFVIIPITVVPRSLQAMSLYITLSEIFYSVKVYISDYVGESLSTKNREKSKIGLKSKRKNTSFYKNTGFTTTGGADLEEIQLLYFVAYGSKLSSHVSIPVNEDSINSLIKSDIWLNGRDLTWFFNEFYIFEGKPQDRLDLIKPELFNNDIKKLESYLDNVQKCNDDIIIKNYNNPFITKYGIEAQYDMILKHYWLQREILNVI